MIAAPRVLSTVSSTPSGTLSSSGEAPFSAIPLSSASFPQAMSDDYGNEARATIDIFIPVGGPFCTHSSSYWLPYGVK